MKYLPIILILICSCGVQEQLTDSYHEDYLVIGIEKNKVEVLNPGYMLYERELKRATKEIKIVGMDSLQCGDYLISEFRFN